MKLNFNRFVFLASILLFIFWVGFRFYGLDVSPPGFYVDEAIGASQILCLADSGHDLQGQTWPIFSEVIADGYTSFTYLYAGVIWTKIWGTSVFAIRSLFAFLNVIEAFAIFFLTFFILRSATFFTQDSPSNLSIQSDKKFQFGLSFIAALIFLMNPWSFQTAHIAWDPPMVPFFLVLGYAVFFSSESYFAVIFSAVLLSFSAYSYPPGRASVILTMMATTFVLFCSKRNYKEDESLKNSYKQKSFFKKIIIWFATFFIVSIPLIQFILQPKAMRRAGFLSILGKFQNEPWGAEKIFLLIKEYLYNLSLHFDPQYLFFTGDRNYRHSSQLVGMLSWLEFFIFVLVAVVILYALVTWFVGARSKIVFEWINQKKFFFIWVILMVLCGTTPAALTWEGLPHSLRSNAAMVFWPLFSMGLIWFLYEMLASDYAKRVLATTLTLLMILFTFLFSTAYYKRYPLYARAWFDTSMIENYQTHFNELKNAEHVSFPDTLQPQYPYPPRALVYYQMHFFGQSCEEAKKRVGMP